MASTLQARLTRNPRETTLWAITLAVVAALLATSIWLRWPQQDMTFFGDPAPWHVLHTMDCFDRIPKNEHLFLPLVTPDDMARGVPWGSSLRNLDGTYYYSSFPAAGFFLPYFFTRLFGLPKTMETLYIFNSVLYVAAFALTAAFFSRLFKKRLHPCFTILFTAGIYLFSPEILHGQGISYWCHSIFQVIFPAQLLCFTAFEKKWPRRLFYALCILGPFVEWTGFVANAGFCIVLLAGRAACPAPPMRQRLRGFFFTALATVIGGLAVLVHFLCLVELRLYLQTLFTRVAARSFQVSPFSSLLQGYATSFGWAWCLLAALLALAILLPSSRKMLWERSKSSWQWLFITVFPLLENLVMVEHANSYSFDRMKMVFPLLLLLVAAAESLVKAFAAKKLLKHGLCALLIASSLAVGTANFYCYLQIPGNYLYGISAYRAENRTMAAALQESYPRAQSMYGLKDFASNSYINLTFGGGFAEFAAEIDVVQRAAARGLRYAVLMEAYDHGPMNLKIHKATVLDLYTWEAEVFTLPEGATEVVRTPADLSEYYAPEYVVYPPA